MKFAIVGGTGAFGRALAQRLRHLDEEVVLGSRDRERAEQLALVLGTGFGTNEEVVQGADYVILAVQSSAAVTTARELAEAIGETPVLCVASDLHFGANGVTPGRSEGSIAEDVAAALRGPVASGYQALAAAHLARRDLLDEDVLVCGDDPDAKQVALDLGARFVSGRAIDVGPLANARALEAMTAVILHVNKSYKIVAGLRLTGFRD